MPRPSLPSRVCAGLVAAAVVVVGAGSGTPSAGAPATAGSTEHEGPLHLTIDAMTPGALPETGAIRIRGTITNTDDETWSNVQLFPFAGTDAPMTTSAELEVATATAPTAVVGPRITDVMDVVGDLEPGETATYRIRLPRRLIDITLPGIYWFGVHALGRAETTPRDAVADGRARTFLPYLPDAEEVVPTAIVVPLRQQVAHTPRGAVAEPRAWRRTVARGGLRRLLDLGAAADGLPVSWVLDPALLDVVDQLRVGNPTRSVSPTLSPEDDAEGEGEAEADEEPPPAPDSVADTPVARAADGWLTDARTALEGEQVWTLPYGDLDVAAAADHGPEYYDTARDQQSRLGQEWGLLTRPVVTSPSGYLDDQGLALADDNPLVLLTDRMFSPEQFPDGAPSVVTVDGHRAAVTSYAAASGGPGPDPRRSAVALRQRVLSEAAARSFEAGTTGPRPLLVTVPRAVSGNPDQFWSELNQPWVDLTTVDDAASGTATAVTPDQLTYPERYAELELPGEAFDTADRIMEQGSVLQDLLTLNDTVAAQLSDETLSGLGHRHRNDPVEAIGRLRAIEGWTQRRVGGVSIVAPPGVTLASGSGEFAVTLQNDLHQSVTVGIRGESDGASIDPMEPIVVAPESHNTVVLNAHTTGTGVHNLTLDLVSAEGDDLGGGTTVPVRSGQVSVVIWWILGSGAGILVLAIGIRLVRRFRGVSTSSTDEDTVSTSSTNGEGTGSTDGDGSTQGDGSTDGEDPA